MQCIYAICSEIFKNKRLKETFLGDIHQNKIWLILLITSNDITWLWLTSIERRRAFIFKITQQRIEFVYFTKISSLATAFASIWWCWVFVFCCLIHTICLQTKRKEKGTLRIVWCELKTVYSKSSESLENFMIFTFELGLNERSRKTVVVLAGWR